MQLNPRPMVIISSVLCCLSFIYQASCMGPSERTFQSAIFETCHTLIDDRGPFFSGSVLVAQGDDILFHEAHGLNHTVPTTPLTTKNSFFIGSFTQALIATTLLRLEDLGKLSIHDPIAKYFPSFPNGKSITIHHLMAHRSGIRDYQELAQAKVEQTGDVLRLLSNSDALHVIQSSMQKKADFKPGYCYQESRSNYIILSALIELLWRPYNYPSLADATNDLIWYQLGVPCATWCYTKADDPMLAKPSITIDQDTVGLTTLPVSYLCATGDGNLALTAHQAYLLTRASVGFEDRLIKPETQKQLYNAHSSEKCLLPNDEKRIVNHSYVWSLGKRGGIKAICHAGREAGYWWDIAYYPLMDLYIIILSNTYVETIFNELGTSLAKACLYHLSSVKNDRAKNLNIDFLKDSPRGSPRSSPHCSPRMTPRKAHSPRAPDQFMEAETPHRDDSPRSESEELFAMLGPSPALVKTFDTLSTSTYT